jgi:hypothetical protein
MAKAGVKQKKAQQQSKKPPCFGVMGSVEGDCRACRDKVACMKTLLSAPVLDLEVGRVLVEEIKKARAQWAH